MRCGARFLRRCRGRAGKRSARLRAVKECWAPGLAPTSGGSPMNERMLARVLVPILALVAASLSACSSSGSVASPQATPSAAAAAPTTPAPPSAAPSPSAPPASPDPLAEGDYVSPPLTAEMMVAAVEAHGLDPADARSFVAEEGYTENEVVTMRLADGQLTLLQSMDGGTPDSWMEGCVRVRRRPHVRRRRWLSDHVRVSLGRGQAPHERPQGPVPGPG